MKGLGLGIFIYSLWAGIILLFIIDPIHTTTIANKEWECTETKYPSKELNEKFAPYCIQYTKTEGR